MAITPYRPTTDPIRPFLEDFLGSGWGGRLGGTDMMRSPSADVVETKDEIRVMLELPGMRPEDVEVSLEDNVLTISGEKSEEREEEDGDHRWHLSECRYGRFSRSFVLPRDVEQERTQADFQNGVLRVTIPKSEKVKPRRIEVGGGTDRHRVETGQSK
ncbi:MAG: Hsp20/alpha crystallin family protein [Longimicrobiales bacterium]